MRKRLWVLGVGLLGATSGEAAVVIISEVHPTGSSASYAADWFELTNTGLTTVDITGWKMDDNSNSSAAAVALRGVTSIAPGQSVVFAEGNASGSNDATIQTNLKTAWFGTSVPFGFTIGGYGGTSVGLGGTGDAVNIFDSSNVLITRVDFGAATTGTTFDNAAGLDNATISTLSVAGINGAFTAPSGEIGSPGVPEPSAAWVIGMSSLACLSRRRRGTAR